MLTKTHVAIVVFGILVFIGVVVNKPLFVVAALLSVFIPDVDSRFSTVGRKWYFRPLQFFVKHRGIFHSFTFLFVVTLALVWFFPTIALGFFLGYGLHLLADSFTVDGIRPFYPLKKKITGKVHVGSVVETGIFVFFVLADVVLLIAKFI